MINYNNIILGTLNFDYDSVSENFNQLKINNLLQKSNALGINCIDTAYYYGKTELFLGNTNLLHLFKVNSKANPWLNNDFSNGIFGELNYKGIEHQLTSSLKNLNIERFDTYFLHCWDYDTPISETLNAFDEFYRTEKFDKFGVSNINIQQLQTIIDLCEKQQLIQPKVYQGMYNVYCRKIEEIFPILENYSIEFQSYNPLAGGLLTGKYYNTLITNGRFINNEIYQSIFWNPTVVANTKNLTADLSLRWLRHYSLLKNYDSIIIGCSTENQLMNNCQSINNTDLLNNEQLSIIDNFYSNIKHLQPNYFY